MHVLSVCWNAVSQVRTFSRADSGVFLNHKREYDCESKISPKRSWTLFRENGISLTQTLSFLQKFVFIWCLLNRVLQDQSCRKDQRGRFKKAYWQICLHCSDILLYSAGAVVQTCKSLEVFFSVFIRVETFRKNHEQLLFQPFAALWLKTIFTQKTLWVSIRSYNVLAKQKPVVC